MSDIEFIFEIGAYSPETFPLERLGAYMADLGAMLGDQQLVNFSRLEAGSTKIVHRVRAEAVTRVEKTIVQLASGEAEGSKLRAFEAINKRLKDDNAEGIYRRKDTGAVVLQFPGKQMREPEVVGPIDKASVIDGVLISLGGRDNTVPVRLQSENTIFICSATREIAKQLAPYLFGQELRLTGIGRWLRRDPLGWQLEHFKIESFTTLSEKSLLQTVSDIRSTEAEWDRP